MQTYEPQSKNVRLNPKKQFYRTLTDDEGKETLIITHSMMLEFLENNGFGKYYVNEKIQYIQIENNIVRLLTKAQISDFIIRYIKNLPNMLGVSTTRAKLLEKVLASKSLLAESLYEKLDTIRITEPTPVQHAAYRYFRNTVVRIDDTGAIDKIPYKDLKWHVWESNIIDRDIDFNRDVDFTKCIYARFFELLARVTELTDEEREKKGEKQINLWQQKRLIHLQTLAGYLLHSHKDRANAKAVILVEQSMNEGAQGGTGKGLFAQGILHSCNGVLIEGRNLNFNDPFAWQRLDVDTQVCVIDDVGRSFPFQQMYSYITEGWPVRKLYKGEFYIPFHQAPKPLILNNYVPEDADDSTKRRMYVYEVSRFFNKDNTPKKEFEISLFDEFDAEQWHLYDHYINHCIRTYLQQGVIESDSVTIDDRALRQNVPEHLVEFLNEFVQAKTEGAKFTTTEIMQQFYMNEKYKNSKKYDPRHFGRLINAYITHSTQPQGFLKKTIKGQIYYEIKDDEKAPF